MSVFARVAVLVVSGCLSGCFWCGATVPCSGNGQCTQGLVCLAVTPGSDNTCETKTCEHPCQTDVDCNYFTQQNRSTSCKPVPAQCGTQKICQL